MTRLLLIACLVLAACGANGPPEPPAKSGVSVSGEAQIGLVLK
jgi:predicted small lipoprotein YifL